MKQIWTTLSHPWYHQHSLSIVLRSTVFKIDCFISNSVRDSVFSGLFVLLFLKCILEHVLGMKMYENLSMRPMWNKSGLDLHIDVINSIRAHRPTIYSCAEQTFKKKQLIVLQILAYCCFEDSRLLCYKHKNVLSAVYNPGYRRGKTELKK